MSSDDEEYVPSLPVESKYSLRKRKVVSKNNNDGESDDEDICLITISKKQKKSTSFPESKISRKLNVDLPVVPFQISSFDDLYRLAASCSPPENKMYKDCQRLPAIWPILQEIKALIGLNSVKNALCDLVVYEMAAENNPETKREAYWRNMVITGEPGTGKTTIAKIIARLLNKIGKTDSDEIVLGNQRNMISDFVGQTKSCVDAVVKQALEGSGILFIDEAPSLNDNRKNAQPDSYSRSCLDTLLELMDEHKEKLIVIFAGYEEEMQRNILGENKGLRRRIQWYFNIEKYTPPEMFEIFQKLVKDGGFEIPKNCVITARWFAKHDDFFPFFGGSIRNFMEKISTIQIRKRFGQTEKLVLDNETIMEGFKLYRTFCLDQSMKSPAMTSMKFTLI
jgi:hypothetical protein